MALNTDSTNYLTVRRLWSIMSSFKDKIVTALGGKSDKSATVSNVAWSSSKLTKTINGTTTDVVSASTLKSAMSLNNVTNDAQVKRSEMGTASGVATLDANGIINTSQLPSYVDDVLEYSAKSQFPATGETGKIYVDTSTNLTWRWSGTTYVEISPSLALGETSSTAYRGDRGKAAYDHSQVTSGNPHNVTATDVKAVSYDTNEQGLTDTQKGNARTNIGLDTAATLLNNLTEGNSDIVTTDDGDNVLIATTDNGGSVTNKWYKRKLVKLIPWIIKKLGTRLVYDCGAGSTSGDDFDAALAAFNAGQWVIIRKDGIAYYCVGSYSGPGLRFKQLANDGSLLKVNTISWTRGSSPSAVTQTEASLSGHTHTRSDITNFAHTHGNIQNSGKLQTSDVTIASGDKLVVTDSSNDDKVARASASFDGLTTTNALTQKGTFETFMTPSAGNAASGALRNLTAQLTEGTSNFTDNTEIFTSYAGNSGFAEAGYVNQPYRRKASSMLNYIEGKRFITRSPANVDIATKRIQLGYGLYTSSNVGCCCYLVHVFFNYVDANLRGVGATLLVNYDWRFSSYQKAKCVILNDNGLREAGYNIVLANFLTTSNDIQYLHITLGLVKNTAPTTLVSFSYSYCKIFYVAGDLNWTHSVTSDTIGTYNYLIPAEFEKADSLNTSVNAGSANQPVYFNNGVPTACNWWVS